LRVIAGRIKGRRLQAPGPGDLSVRPTADRAREALFSILQRWPVGPFLDLCAGTGAVALEAWSRGYAPVACVERDPRALACIKVNANGADLRILAKDASKLPGDAFANQAVVFADPPYESSLALWQSLAPRIGPWLAPEGVLVWEAGHGTELPAVAGLEEVEARRYGAAVFHIFRPVSG
jgi:16S rRNA (guanine966-N2)-methyltransferase